jgi:hypothetical protein
VKKRSIAAARARLAARAALRAHAARELEHASRSFPGGSVACSVLYRRGLLRPRLSAELPVGASAAALIFA